MNDMNELLEHPQAEAARHRISSSNGKFMNVGFIGLGHMGAGMAANLLKAGHRVTVFNRTPAKAEALIAHGATLATSIAEATRGDAVVTMLANDEAVEDVVLGRDGVIANLPSGGLHVSSSTISVALSERLTEAHTRKRQKFVAAPVFGRPDVAAAGRLFIVAGGDAAAVEAAAPLLDAIGQKTFVISDMPKAANLVKLSGNFLGASVIEALGEAMALVGKAGIDERQYLEFLTSTLFDAPIYKTYGSLIARSRRRPTRLVRHRTVTCRGRGHCCILNIVKVMPWNELQSVSLA